jgi:hypothetical protein
MQTVYNGKDIYLLDTKHCEIVIEISFIFRYVADISILRSQIIVSLLYLLRMCHNLGDSQFLLFSEFRYGGQTKETGLAGPVALMKNMKNATTKNSHKTERKRSFQRLP